VTFVEVEAVTRTCESLCGRFVVRETLFSEYQVLDRNTGMRHAVKSFEEGFEFARKKGGAVTLYDEIMGVARKHGIVKIEAGIIYVHLTGGGVWTFTVPMMEEDRMRGIPVKASSGETVLT
jgi:hypothetical protein